MCVHQGKQSSCARPGLRLDHHLCGARAWNKRHGFNADPHRACIACAKPNFYSLTRNAPSVRPNQGKTYAIHTWLSTAIWYCREPRKHDNDTGDVARGQRWSTPCMHCVRKAEFLLLDPECPVSAVQPRQNTRNPHLVLQAHLVLPRAAKT